MQEHKSFQTIVLAVFIVLAALAVGIFALQKSDPGPDPVPILVWGTFDKAIFNDLRANTFFPDETVVYEIKYGQLREEVFQETLVERLAEGRGPDIVLAPHEQLFELESKLIKIPYDVISRRNFKDAYVLAAEVLLSPSGLIGLPLAIDPMIMYWNRDILSSNGYVDPPAFWEEIPSFTEKVTEISEDRNISRSAVSFGEYENVSHAKALISTLLLQAGTSIISYGPEGELEVDFPKQHGLPIRPAESTIRFFTEYSDPTSKLFTWNLSMPSSRQAFLSGDLALYFGRSSERERVRAGNPNLNIDTAEMPQIKDSGKKVVYADVYGFGILKQTRVPNHAFAVAQGLVGGRPGERFSAVTDLAPALKSLVVKSQEDPFKTAVYNSAIIARSWVDVDFRETDRIFKEMIENFTSGRLRISESISRATEELNKLIEE